VAERHETAFDEIVDRDPEDTSITQQMRGNWMARSRLS
jgi:hypothetical protein